MLLKEVELRVDDFIIVVVYVSYIILFEVKVIYIVLIDFLLYINRKIFFEKFFFFLINVIIRVIVY